jgi:D-3-phosphoglycerate dehydrogenase|tara:strand:- start:2257 stop:3180 length:924 start_codon:yes stop_codon:yes gene_type:complete
MKIVICDTLSSKVLEELQSIGNCIDISSSLSKEKALDTEIVEAEILVIRSSTKLTKEIIKKGNNLKIIARCGVGIDNIDVEYAKSKNIKITNSPSANLLSVVELTVALIINAARKINLSDNHLKDGKWNRKEFIGMELSGKQLGIVGYGKVGRLVSDRMKSFGMSIAFYDPYIDDWDGPENNLELDELLTSSDVISIHVIKTEETENLISREKLALLKKSAILVNTSRGGVVDEDYLIEMLRSKQLFGAGLDVYSEEPPKNIDNFVNINLITTPHIGASTNEAQLKAGLETVENIKKILAGDSSVEI